MKRIYSIQTITTNLIVFSLIMATMMPITGYRLFTDKNHEIIEETLEKIIEMPELGKEVQHLSPSFGNPIWPATWIFIASRI